MPDSTALGCRVSSSHLHVLRRENANGAWAKRQQSAAPGKAKPVDFLVVQGAWARRLPAKFDRVVLAFA
ncbi:MULTISPECIES: hypothetical protein [Streptomyces]|nr:MULTISPECIES: hypothetical protein [Streptomyces]QSY49523.1 hypothetical protein J3S04_32315 [Streptomyces griseocarneus]